MISSLKITRCVVQLSPHQEGSAEKFDKTSIIWRLCQLYVFHPSVLLLTIKSSQSARENSLSYGKKSTFSQNFKYWRVNSWWIRRWKRPILFIIYYFYFLIYFFLDDHSRVVLGQINGDPKSDYINASYIPVRTQNCQNDTMRRLCPSECRMCCLVL